MFTHQNPVFTFIQPLRYTFSAHISLLGLITQIIFGEEYEIEIALIFFV
jgi:hypothetical protein